MLELMKMNINRENQDLVVYGVTVQFNTRGKAKVLYLTQYEIQGCK